ncbi:putative Acylphosphate phosphohydrolase [Desulfurella amilsii]|uniref:acylphosphatase n=1 Tax=Desulfurella amilsii TaxID=1562698 RepID=A0A1X4XWZ2_9BACT|nr:acylphosphatase [Desulfurella amilsii]OSS42060.1 putative Acylphosphate phosphohydrolase [Desulfurella amilsii]
MSVCKFIRITGKVQNVGFRAYLETIAKQLGLSGYVRNVGTNIVESVVCGERELVAKYISACKIGPKRAIVENLEVQDAQNTNYEGFNIWL